LILHAALCFSPPVQAGMFCPRHQDKVGRVVVASVLVIVMNNLVWQEPPTDPLFYNDIVNRSPFVRPHCDCDISRRLTALSFAFVFPGERHFSLSLFGVGAMLFALVDFGYLGGCKLCSLARRTQGDAKLDQSLPDLRVRQVELLRNLFGAAARLVRGNKLMIDPFKLGAVPRAEALVVTKPWPLSELVFRKGLPAGLTGLSVYIHEVVSYRVSLS
jgi:hypothetical protein